MLRMIRASLLLLFPLMSSALSSQAAESVSIYNWSDYIAPDTLKNFQIETGIAPIYDVYDSNETLHGKLMTGHSGYDVVFPSNHFMERQIQGGALKTLDRQQLPNWNNLNPALLKALQVNDPGNQHGFPYLWGSTGIGLNLDKVKAVLGDGVALDSWALIFKPENMKKLSQCGVAILDNGPELLPITLNYLGLAPHSKRAQDYQKAEHLLMAVRPFVSYFHSSRYVSDLANGNICVAVGFSGDILQAQRRAKEANNGVNIRYVIPREGSAIWFDMVAMPIDAPDEKAGYAFMNFLLSPPVMADISNSTRYANGNLQADALVDSALRTDSSVYLSPGMIGRLFALQVMPPDIDRLRTRIWNQVKAGK